VQPKYFGVHQQSFDKNSGRRMWMLAWFEDLHGIRMFCQRKRIEPVGIQPTSFAQGRVRLAADKKPITPDRQSLMSAPCFGYIIAHLYPPARLIRKTFEEN